MTDDKCRPAAEHAASRQIYIAKDILPGCVYVNKRVPLTVCGVEESERDAVRARLVSLYGGETVAEAFAGGKCLECALSDLPGDFESVDIPAQSLTERKRFDFSDLHEIMARLRGEGGCEWDRAQDHGSIRINLIEEAYELVDAIDHADVAGMLEESGDILMQAVFHAQIAEEAGEFDYGDMVTGLCRKLLDRHTHIFGANHADNAEQALGFWNEAKKKEKKYTSNTDAMDRVPQALGFWNEAKKKEKKYTSNTDAMDRVPKNLPALLYAEKVQKVAKRAGFDWSDYAPAAEKVKEELDEFLAADAAHMTEEGGDLLFAAVNLLRLKKVEAENALREASAKFFRRFGAVEEAVKARGKEMTELSLEELDKIWNEVKSSEKEVE